MGLNFKCSNFMSLGDAEGLIIEFLIMSYKGA